MKKYPDLLDPNDPIIGFLDQAWPLWARLPFKKFLPRMAELMGPYLRGSPMVLVYSMADALIDCSDAFPAGEALGQELYRRQGRALSWQQASYVLEDWARKAREQYVIEQGLLVKEVIARVERIDTEDRLWEEDTTPEQRLDNDWGQKEWLPRLLRQEALWTVRLYLLKRKLLSRPRKLKGQKPKKSRSSALGLEQAKAQILRLFQENLRRLRGKG